MPRLSIIIPWWDENPALEDTLVSVLTHRPEDSEILVVHRLPYNDPWDLAGEVDFERCDAETETDLVVTGIRGSTGDLVHVLRAGCEVTEGWAEAPVERLLAEPRLGTVVPLVIQRERPERLVSVGVGSGYGATRRVLGSGQRVEQAKVHEHVLGPTLAAGFYRRDSLSDVGGFDPSMGDAWSDLDLALALQSAGWETAVESASVVLGGVEPCSPPSFVAGRNAARFYRRHANTLSAGWGAHLLATLAHYVTRPSLGLLADIGGRIAGYRETPVARFSAARTLRMHGESRSADVRPAATRRAA